MLQEINFLYGYGLSFVKKFPEDAERQLLIFKGLTSPNTVLISKFWIREMCVNYVCYLTNTITMKEPSLSREKYV